MTFRLANIGDRAALVDDGDNYFDLETISGGSLGSDPMAALGQADQLHELSGRLSTFEATGSIGDVVLGAPVPRPRNSYGIGLNYLAHAEESDMELPKTPLVFTKFPSCIVGPTSEVELRTETGDYEAEMVVVIGTAGRDIAEADAWNHVVGVTAGQDISDRRLQFAAKPPHFDLGKSRDTYGPIGPVLVSVDSLADPDDVSIICDINGERRQTGSTAKLIFSVPALIAYISSISTLEPGDIIFTGTPEGVGAASQTYLQPGDVITTTLGGIGTMANTCR